LRAGDVVVLSAGALAQVSYDRPPPVTLRGGARHTVEAPGREAASREASATGGPDVWSVAWRFLGRLTGSEVEGPPTPREGGVRAGERPEPAYLPTLALPTTSTSLTPHPTLTWGPRGEARETFEVKLFAVADASRCWGGTRRWSAETIDTTLALPRAEPVLAPGAAYRVEVESRIGYDYACFRVASEAERAEMEAALARLARDGSEGGGAGEGDASTLALLRAGVLAGEGYVPDALAILQELLRDHPEHKAAREAYHVLLRDAAARYE
jgi:hypothetical protein